MVNLLLRMEETDIEDRDGTDNTTALMEASGNGHLETVKCLVKAGADIGATSYQVADSKKDSGHTALHMASYHGQDKVVKYLLKSGAQVDAVSRRGRTPLHDACKSGHSQVVELLVEAGADIAAQDEDGVSAVYWATVNNRVAEVVTLIQLGAPTNLRTRCGRTPLSQARMDGNDQLIDILSGLRKLLWTKEGKESINAAKSDKEKLVSLLVNASDQSMGPDSVAAGLLGSRTLTTKRKPSKKVSMKRTKSMPRLRFDSEIDVDRFECPSTLTLPRGR